MFWVLFFASTEALRPLTAMNVEQYYLAELASRGYQPDDAQRAAIARLQQCFDEWGAYLGQRKGTLAKLIKRPGLPKGVYMWGGVGRGKSFLMDSFYSVLPLKRKTRLHFHEFMREVHRELEELRGQKDPLDVLAKRIARRYRMICFDEFHISDVADAMILHRLLDQLFANGVQFVMTSNYEPSTLYPNGIHRDRVLPAIALLQQKLDVLNVDAGIDYRKRTLEQVEAYLTPLSDAATATLNEAFTQIAEIQDEDPAITIENRELKAVRRAGGAVWFSFDVLCRQPRSQNDFLEIARRFHTVILSDVPKMPLAMANEARRFTWLIDVFYDHKVKFLMSAEVEADQLYIEGPMANEFHRTVSRIIEMQSKEYREQPHRVVDTALT